MALAVLLAHLVVKMAVLLEQCLLLALIMHQVGQVVEEELILVLVLVALVAQALQ